MKERALNVRQVAPNSLPHIGIAQVHGLLGLPRGILATLGPFKAGSLV